MKITGLVLALSVLGSCTNRGEIEVLNRSKEPVRDISITVCGQDLVLTDLKPGQRALLAYAVKGDSGFKVQLNFASGKSIKRNLGYVTNGLNFRSDLVIGDTDIQIKSIRVK